MDNRLSERNAGCLCAVGSVGDLRATVTSQSSKYVPH